MHISRMPFAVTLLWISAIPNLAAAQVKLPVADKNVEALVTVLNSDAGEFEKAKACQQLAIVGDGRAVAAIASLLADPHLATYARSALEAIDEPSALESLIRASSTLKGDLLAGVIHSIGKRGNADSVEALSRHLESSEPLIQTEAARAIARLATDRSAALLTARLDASANDATRARPLSLATLLCAAELQRHDKHASAMALLDRLARQDIPERVRRMARYQQIVAEHPRAKQLLDGLLKSEQSDLFRLGLRAARETELDKRVLPELAARMDELDTPDQVILIHALATLGDQRVLPVMLEAARSADPSIRLAAVRALGALGDSRCLALLRDGALSKDEAFAEASREALGQLALPAIDGMVEEMIMSDSLDHQTAGADLAGRRAVKAVRPRLVELMTSRDRKLRQVAVAALGRTASMAEFPALLRQAIESSTGADASISQQALKTACIRLPRGQVAEQIGRVLSEATAPNRPLLLSMLTAVGGDRALELVAAAARSNDGPLRDASSQELGKWPSADVAPILLELASAEGDRKYQIRALRGLIRVARQLDMTTHERTDVCRQALQLATRDEERRLVLEVLRRNPSSEGLQLAQSMNDHRSLAGQVAAVVAACEQAKLSENEVESGFHSLFDGKTLDGWHGNLEFWSVKDGSIAGGDLESKVKQNEFLRSDREYEDFELRLQFRLVGDRTNGGIQIRTQEIPGDHEVSGYQADLGEGWWGCLYDESRRRRALAGPPAERRESLVRKGEWNDYRIVCRGRQIQLWLNGKQTVDYLEADATIPMRGIIALQTHGNLKMIAYYRNIRLKPIGKKETP